MQRLRSTPHTFEQKLQEAKNRFLTEALKLSPGPQLDELQQKINQLETAAYLNVALSAGPSKSNPNKMDGQRAYRAYLIGAGDVIIWRVDLECEDDETAKAQAKLLVDGYDVELWDGARRMETFTTHEPSVIDSDELKALAEIQLQIIDMRRMAGEATDTRKRDACLRIADAIEKRARELDRSNAW